MTWSTLRVADWRSGKGHLRQGDQLHCCIIGYFVYMGVEKYLELMFKRWEGKQTMIWAPKFSLMERKRLMSVAYDEVKMGEKFIQFNSVNPTSSVRSSSNHYWPHFYHSLLDHTIAATHVSLLVLKPSRQALLHGLDNGHSLCLETSSPDAASFPQVFAQMSLSPWCLPGPVMYKIRTFHLSFSPCFLFTHSTYHLLNHIINCFHLLE